jgi:PAS domain S-box-containing protein
MDGIPWSPNLITLLINVLKTGILFTDKQGGIRFSNHLAGELLGYPPDGLTGQSIELLFLPEDTDFFLPNILKLTGDKACFAGEVLLKKKEGNSFFVNLSTTLYVEESTGEELIIFTLQDITHFKMMEKEQFDSERFIGLGMMTDQISHQIRNPVAAIGGFALRLAKDRTSPEEFNDYTKIIQNKARQLETIINRLVEFAHVNPDRYFPLTPGDIFEGVKKGFRKKGEGILNRLQFPDPQTLSTAPLFGDLMLIIRAVQSLIQNGLEAGSNRSEVTVSCESLENEVRIRVKDRGEGILSEHLPFIFDPFYTTKFNSLGLGLTMAKRIVQVHKGTITVESTSQEGTVVSFILPRDRRREIRTRLLQKNSSDR